MRACVCVCVNACPKGLKGNLWRSLQRGDVGAGSYLLDHADGTDPEDDASRSLEHFLDAF